MALDIFLWLLAGYAIGSVPFALLVSRAFGLPDPRTFGSGNPGATNVLRTGNKAAAALTLVGDALKGWLAVWLAEQLTNQPLLAAVAGLGAFLGHVFSFWLRFRGGKGVATGLGVLVGIQPVLGATAAGIWLVVALITRYSSLSALTAATLVPIAAWLMGLPTAQLVVLVLLCGILIARHRQNIRNLLAGTESKIGSRS